MNYTAGKVAYHTLGCKLNFAETSAIAKQLEARGFVRATGSDVPDLCVVNTCSVTEMADKKGRSLIRRLASRYPDATIVVTGCYAQLRPDQVVAIEGVDIVLGSDEKLRITEFLDRWMADRRQSVNVIATKDIRDFRPSCERGDRTRYFLKVQDGCDYWCSYCTIPMARGRSRSGTIDDIVAQAERVAAEGGREIVLTGVNIGDFGKGRDDSFFDLIRRLDEVEGIARYRISSIEPNLLTPEIIRWVARDSRAFMPHFHIPLQSGSDEVLRLMRRRYDTGLFAERIALVREEMPHAFIGVDIIAGARGEDSAEWEKSLAFARSLPVQQYHVFPYSERPDTAALRLDGAVDAAEKHRRVAQLLRVSEEKYGQFVDAMIGTERNVLWEQPREGEIMHGFTDNYVRVEAPLRQEMINTVSKVRLGTRKSEDTVEAIMI